MNRTSLAWAALTLVPAAMCAAPAWAATSASIVVVSQGETLPRSSIQLFSAETGAEIQMEEKDDDRVAALFLLDRGRYRVAVNGRTVRDISVTGTGAQTFTIEVLPTAAAPRAQGLTPEDERSVANYMQINSDERRNRRNDLAQNAWSIATLIADRQADTQAGIGFQRPSGGSETFAGRNIDSIRMAGVAIGVAVPVGHDWRTYVRLNHAEGDETDRGDIPAGGGTDVGMPYGGFSFGGSTGVNLGPQGAVWSTDTQARNTGVRVQAGPQAERPVNWYIFADFQHESVDYDGVISIDAFGETFGQTRDQQITENRLGAGVGAAFSNGGWGRFQIGAWGEVGLYGRNTEFRSVEHNVCPLCGPPDQDFFLSFSEEDSGMTWGAGAGVKIGVPLGDLFSLELGVSASYLDEVGSVFNISSGDQVLDGRTTELRDTDMLLFQGSAAINYRW